LLELLNEIGGAGAEVFDEGKVQGCGQMALAWLSLLIGLLALYGWERHARVASGLALSANAQGMRWRCARSAPAREGAVGLVGHNAAEYRGCSSRLAERSII